MKHLIFLMGRKSLKHAFGLAVMVMTCFAAASTAMANEDLGLEDFTGQWTSSGDAFGQPARSTLAWSAVLGDKFYHIDYKIKMGAPEFSTPMFEGAGYYKELEAGQYQAFWADSSGDLHPIRAKRTEKKLTSVWGVAGKKLGRTEYHLINANTLEVTDWIMQNYDWKMFNRNKFTRQNIQDVEMED